MFCFNKLNLLIVRHKPTYNRRIGILVEKLCLKKLLGLDVKTINIFFNCTLCFMKLVERV